MHNKSDRVLRARLAAHESWANTSDRSARTANARHAFHDRFEQQVDPDGTLSPIERRRRAESARSAYFTRLALKSAQSRRRNKEPRRGRTAINRQAEQANSSTQVPE